MSRLYGSNAMALALSLVLLSLGCFSEEPIGPSGGGTGTSGDADDACACDLLDLRATDLEVDASGAVSGDQVLPDGTFELRWTLEYAAEECDAVQATAEFLEQVRVTRGGMTRTDEATQEMDPGDTLNRSALSTAFFQTLGAGEYTAEVWLLDVDTESECGANVDPTDNNEGSGAPTLDFELPPA